MGKLWIEIISEYVLQELQELNIPEDVLWRDKYWKIYAEEINIKNPKKKLQISLAGLASICWCKAIKKELMETLWIVSNEYTLPELRELNIPEEVLWNDTNWTLYAEKINKNNWNKKITISRSSLAKTCWCAKIKKELMEKLWIVSKKYTLQELKELNIPKEVLGDKSRWKPYAVEINIKNPKKKLPTTLYWLARICWCKAIKKVLMEKLWIVNK